MRAILIDPVNRVVEEKDLPNAELQTIYSEIGVNEFSTAGLGSRVYAYIDDRGLYRKGQSYWYFDMPGGRVLMAGKALIMSVDHTGEAVDLDFRASVDDTRQIIRWVGKAREAEAEIVAGKVPRPSVTVNGQTVWEWSPDQETL
jgi:hypothetical protein